MYRRSSEASVPIHEAPASPAVTPYARMPFKGILVIAVAWLFFFVSTMIEFVSLGLVPVFAPFFAMLILGGAGVVSSAYAYARSLPPRVARVRPSAVHRPGPGVSIDIPFACESTIR